MSKALMCPNCTEAVADHPENGCLLAALVQVIRDRGTMFERPLRKLHAETDADALWNVLGPIADRLEEGDFKGDAGEIAKARGAMPAQPATPDDSPVSNEEARAIARAEPRTIRHGSEYWKLHADGAIERPGLVAPHAASWRVIGAVELTNFGNVRRFYSLAEIIADPRAIPWKFKNGKQRVYVRDMDHGTMRQWGASAEVF